MNTCETKVEKNDDAAADNAATSNKYFDPLKIFVNGIPLTAKEECVKTYFRQYGSVRDVRLIYNNCGDHKGYGFVTFDTPEQKDAALNVREHNLNGCYLLVKPAFNYATQKNRIFIGGLPMHTTRTDIKTYFSQFGVITSIYKPDRFFAEQRVDYCFVTFQQDMAVAKVMRVVEHRLNNHLISVNYAYNKNISSTENVPSGGKVSAAAAGLLKSTFFANAAELQEKEPEKKSPLPTMPFCPKRGDHRVPETGTNDLVATLKAQLDVKEKSLIAFVKGCGYGQ